MHPLYGLSTAKSLAGLPGLHCNWKHANILQWNWCHWRLVWTAGGMLVGLRVAYKDLRCQDSFWPWFLPGGGELARLTQCNSSPSQPQAALRHWDLVDLAADWTLFSTTYIDRNHCWAIGDVCPLCLGPEWVPLMPSQRTTALPPLLFTYGLICCVSPELENEREDCWRLQPITGYSIAALSIGTNSGDGAGNGDNY